MVDILHLLPATPFGGAQRLALELATAQRADGRDSCILWLNAGDTAREAAHRAGVPDEVAGTGLSRVPEVTRKARDAQLLHVHLAPPWLPLALPRSAKMVLHLHVRPTLMVHEANMRRRIDALAEGQMVKRASRLIAISDWVAAAWNSVYPSAGPKTTVVYNGVSIPESAYPREDTGRPFTLAIACRLSDRKGIEEFIDVAAKIHAFDSSIRFRIAGDGPYRAEYEARSKAAGLADVLHFDGFVTDMAAFWSDVDLAAFTPPFEPFGLRLIEPVAHGVPVIAYLNGSGSDEVIAKCRGIESARYGDVEQLAALALALKTNGDRRRRAAEESLEDVARMFSLGAMARGTDAVYESLICGASNG